MSVYTLNRRAKQTVVDKNAALTDGSRAAGDYANSTNKDTLCDAYLTVQYDTTAPAAGASVANLYVLHGDGEATEKFPNGGDGTVGNNVDPQVTELVGIFEARQPSITVDEKLVIEGIELRPVTDRFVLKNVSGQQFDLTYQLDIIPYKADIT